MMRLRHLNPALDAGAMAVRLLLPLLIFLGNACSSPPRGVYHIVREGQTLYRISRVYAVDERQLARINRIEDPASLRAGTRLYIPGVDRVREIPAATIPPRPASSVSSPPKPDSKSPLKSPVAKHEKKNGSVARPSAAPLTATAVKGRFAWPLKGTLLRTFGSKGSSPCKGLEIAVPRSTPIQAAAAGRVIYSGDGIRNYGNLIILKHDDDFFSVYAYNEKNLINTGSFVSKGERIALSGGPAGGGKPRLYFEIRRGKEAVDPIFYLP